jgi:hypothetical protein
VYDHAIAFTCILGKEKASTRWIRSNSQVVGHSLSVLSDDVKRRVILLNSNMLSIELHDTANRELLITISDGEKEVSRVG